MGISEESFVEMVSFIRLADTAWKSKHAFGQWVPSSAKSNSIQAISVKSYYIDDNTIMK